MCCASEPRCLYGHPDCGGGTENHSVANQTGGLMPAPQIDGEYWG